MAYDKTNTGSLNKNTDKDPSKPETANWGDYKGSINVNGQEFWLTGWIKEATQGFNQGLKFISLSAKPKESAPGQAVVRNQNSDVEDDSVPF